MEEEQAEQNNGSEAERALVRALRDDPPEWGPECVGPEELIELVERGGSAPDAERRLEHIATCAYCRREYTELRAALALAAAMGGPRLEPAPRVMAPAYRPLRRWAALAGAASLAAAAGLLGFWIAARSLESRPVGEGLRTELTQTQRQLNDLKQQLAGVEKERQRLADTLAAAPDAMRLQQNQALLAIQGANRQAANRIMALQGEKARLERQLQSAERSRRPEGTATSQIAHANGEALRSLDAAIQAGRVQMPADIARLTTDLQSKSHSLRSASEGTGIETIEPGAALALSDQPLFRWKADTEGARYAVLVTNTEGRTLAQAKALKTAYWRVSRPLPSGRTLLWQVTSQRPDGTHTQSVPIAFAVLPQERRQQLQAALQALGNSRLRRAALYQGFGLTQEAEREVHRLEAEAAQGKALLPPHE